MTFSTFYFFQNHALKLGVRLIHECGLYTSLYSIGEVLKILLEGFRALNFLTMNQCSKSSLNSSFCLLAVDVVVPFFVV